MSAQPNNHNIKMKLDGGFQYGVIQFLQRPSPRIPPYVCVPHSWILVRHATGTTDTTRAASIVSFPDNEDVSVTERRILQNEKASDRWKLYSAKVIYESHTFEDASKYMMRMAKADIAQEKSVINNDVRPMATPSTSTSVPVLEHNKLTHPLNTTNMNKSKQYKEKTVMNVSNPTKAAQVTNFMPPISVKPLNLEIAKSVAGETGMISRRNSIQTFQNSNDSLRYGHNFQRPMTNDDIGIPRIDPNEPAIRVEHGSQHVAENQQDASQVPLILRQLLLDNVEPVSFSREYLALLQRINNVHSKQTPPAQTNLSVSQKQGSDMKPVVSITIENPDSVAAQPRMVINSFPNYQNVSHIATGPPSNNNSQNLINVASCSYSANQSNVALESPMEVEKEENTFRESNTEAAASINTEPQENHAFDSMLNIWINNAADLFQAMHTGISQSRVITSDFEKALERTNGQFEYFANLFDNLRKLTKRNTDKNTEETIKNTVQENLVTDCDMRETSESTKSANLSDYNCGSDESEIYEEDEDNNENDKADGNVRSFTLPPEYEPGDTRWTLKYQKADPERGIVELIPGRNVYINEIKLAHCKRESQEHKKLGRKLLEEIFSPSALSVCSLTGVRANAFTTNDKNVRPGLDKQGRLAILDYIENYSKQKGWGEFDVQSTINSLRSRLQEIRYKHSKTDAK